MNELRKQFEVLLDIASILRDEDTHWCDKRGIYVNQRVFQDSTTGYLNGAWYAFQEQQKIINMQNCGANEIKSILDSIIPYELDMDTIRKIDKLKELLK